MPGVIAAVVFLSTSGLVVAIHIPIVVGGHCAVVPGSGVAGINITDGAGTGSGVGAIISVAGNARLARGIHAGIGIITGGLPAAGVIAVVTVRVG